MLWLLLGENLVLLGDILIWSAEIS